MCQKDVPDMANMKHEMMRGLRKRGEVYYFALQKNKKRTWHNLHTNDLPTAIRKAAQIRHSPEITSGLMLENCVERFVREKRTMREHGARKGWARRTADSKIYTLRIFAAFCGRITPARATPDHIKRFYESRLRSRNAQTAYGNYMTVRSFFNWCVSERLARENPCVAIKIEAPPAAPRRDFCEPELVAKLINECPREDLKYVLYCGFHAGMRFLEIVESVPWWFDMKRGQVNLRKTPTIEFKDLEERKVPMTEDFLRFVLDEYGLREPFMLHPENKHGKNRYRYDFKRPFYIYMKEQGCPWVTPHIMRHTFASLLASMDPMLGGPSDFEIATWMGIDLRTYQRTYAKLRPRRGALDKAFHLETKPSHLSSASSSSTRS